MICVPSGLTGGAAYDHSGYQEIRVGHPATGQVLGEFRGPRPAPVAPAPAPRN